MSTDDSQSTAIVGLGTRAAHGMVAFFAGATAAKLIGFGTQIILLYLLGRSDFGIVSLAYTITMFVQVIEQAGVGDVLVRRRKFQLWAIPAFWFSLTLGLLSAIIILLAAPIASAIYGKEPSNRDQLFYVLLILATSSLPNALSVVPRAKLSRELRFHALATINFASFSLQKFLTVLFAALGFGPFSFVVPTPIASAATAALLWWWVRPPWALRPSVRRWRYLVGDSTRLLVADVARVLLDQSDYILLGLFRTVEVVGIYTVGFLFSIQTVQILMVNLMTILFPTFTMLNDEPQKQFQGFLNAQRILAMLGVSGCLLQAAAAEPFAHLVFPAKWEPSIIVMQILSLGMATRMVAGASFALLKSQGRFTAILFNRWAFAAIQSAVLAWLLASGATIVSVAIAVSVVASMIGPITFHLAVRPYGAGWNDVARALVRPVVCGLISVGTAWLIAQAMDAAGYGSLPQLVETIVVAVALNVLLARILMRPVWDDLWLRIHRLMPKRAAA